MALNFPSNTSSPYVDPTSGVKYVYNAGIGAWESAIQPPAVVSSTAPDLDIEGFMWWDDVSATLKVYDSGNWQEVAPNVSTQVHVSDTPPGAPGNGSLWWDSESGHLYVYYVDTDSNQWVVANPLEAAVGGNVKLSATAPDASVSVEGDLWYNTLNASLYVFNASSAWEAVGNAVAGVSSVTAGTNVTLGGTGTDPVINVPTGTTNTAGVIELADQSETNAATNSSKALTPSRLAAGISNYLPDATDSVKGVAELATTAETTAGTATDKVVTPAGLAGALPSMGITTPPGGVMAFAGAVAPTGYLECDGAAVDRTTYADLFAVIGTTFGSGNGSTTFNVPDLRGEFVRGWDNGRGFDAGRSLGSDQTSRNKSHTHSINDPGHVHNTTFTDDTADRQTGAASTGNIPTSGSTQSATTGITIDSEGGADARPHNIALMYIIKH